MTEKVRFHGAHCLFLQRAGRTPEGRQEQVGRVSSVFLYMDRSLLCTCVPVFIAGLHFLHNDFSFTHQSEPHSKSPLLWGHCSLSQPGELQKLGAAAPVQPGQTLPEGHPASPPVTPCITVLAQSHARRSLVAGTGLTVLDSSGKAPILALVRRTGKGRQQRGRQAFNPQ